MLWLPSGRRVREAETRAGQCVWVRRREQQNPPRPSGFPFGDASPPAPRLQCRDVASPNEGAVGFRQGSQRVGFWSDLTQDGEIFHQAPTFCFPLMHPVISSVGTRPKVPGNSPGQPAPSPWQDWWQSGDGQFQVAAPHGRRAGPGAGTLVDSSLGHGWTQGRATGQSQSTRTRGRVWASPPPQHLATKLDPAAQSHGLFIILKSYQMVQADQHSSDREVRQRETITSCWLLVLTGWALESTSGGCTCFSF